MIARCVVANRFIIEDPARDLLGRGGMGEVYRATDTQTGEPVAIKALNPEILARSPDLLERFQREGEALRRLNHPNIVKFISAVEEAGCQYLVMEYVGGGSLENLLVKEGRLPTSQVVEIALDLADALTRAHRLGILHRDLKPANVLLTEDSTPRLADFGIAHLSSSAHLTQTGLLVGTIDYLSPEIVQGEAAGERADIWSFGVLLFQMITGQLPFQGESLTARLTAILTQPVPDLAALVPQIPDALADLVYRMLERDPMQRIPSVRQVGLELESILKGRGPVQGPSRKSRFATPAPVGIQKHNLPAQTTPFVGREAELGELVRLLEDRNVRLVTIVGLGGMGKTRLAIEAGARQMQRFEHGVYFVPLAGLRSPEAIVPATAQALGFSFYEGREPSQQLLDYLREKKLLLIYDNFEHLLDGVRFVQDILQSAKDVLVMSTSRVRLGLPEEHLFHLAGMDFPDWETPTDALEYSAVKLFLQSARRARPGFELASEDLKYVARICRLVGGMPLGILLAAAWLEMLTPAEVAAEMQQNIDFLSTDLSGVSERQQSVRAVLDYAWLSLSGQERVIFCNLSVFRGGFTREAVQAVTGAGLRELMGLVNKSLLSRSPVGRYDIHELLRQYGAEKLAETPGDEQASLDRHCAYYAGFLHQREARLSGKSQRAALAEISGEVDNLRAGWEWAVDQGRLEWIESYHEGLGELYQTRGWYQEGAVLLEKAARSLAVIVESTNDHSANFLLGKVLLRLGRLSAAFDTEEQAARSLHASMAIFRELGARRELAYALCYWGGCESPYGWSNEAPFTEGMSILQELGDRKGIGLAFRGLGWIALHRGNYSLAKQRFENSLNLFRELDDLTETTRSLRGLGYVTWIQGRYQEARKRHQEMLALCKELGHSAGIARSLGDLGIDAIGLREVEEARRLFGESLALFKEIGDPQGIADELGDLGELANVMGDYLSAARLAREGQAYWGKVFVELVGWDLRVLGNAECGLGEIPQARRHLVQALEWEVKRGRLGHILLTLVGIAGLLAAVGDKPRSLELLTLVLHHPSSWQWAKDNASLLVARLEAGLPTEIVSKARERGMRRDLDSTVTELLLELGGQME